MRRATALALAVLACLTASDPALAQSFIGEIPDALTSIPPTIVSVSHKPERPGPEDPIEFSVFVTQPYGALNPEDKGDVVEAVCHYSLDGGETWDEIFLEEEGKKNEWRGTLDPLEEPGEILYYVEAFDPYGNQALELPPGSLVKSDGLIHEGDEGGPEAAHDPDEEIEAGPEGDDRSRKKKLKHQFVGEGERLDPEVFQGLRRVARGLSHEGDVESDKPDLYIDGFYFGHNEDHFFLRIEYRGDIDPGVLTPLDSNAYGVAFIPMIPKTKEELLDNIWAWYYAPNVSALTFPPTALVRKSPGVDQPELFEDRFDLKIVGNEAWLRVDRTLVDPGRSGKLVAGTVSIFVSGDFANPVVKPGDATPYSVLYFNSHEITVE